jgi:hypothetical protein
MEKKLTLQKFNIPIQRPIALLTLFFIFLTGITLFQDYLHANFHRYHFYFSESILFKTFWLLFLPVGWLQIQRLKKIIANGNSLSGSLKILGTILLAILIHIMLFSILVFILSCLFLDHTYSVFKNIGFTISEDFYMYLLVYGLIGYHRISSQNSLSESPASQSIQSSSVVPGILSIGSGRNTILIPVQKIVMIVALRPYVSIQLDEKKYLVSESLKSIQARLDAGDFLRIHKSTIVNVNKVVSFRSRMNGDYDVLLSNEQEVRLSRNYVSMFKKRFYHN